MKRGTRMNPCTHAIKILKQKKKIIDNRATKRGILTHVERDTSFASMPDEFTLHDLLDDFVNHIYIKDTPGMENKELG
jgi:hypothetical protein